MSKTILFVHGAWVTPACWARFVERYEGQGFKVLAPAWPYLDRPVQALQQHPDPRFAAVSIKDLVDHFETQIQALPERPILVGHSFGGLIVQMLLDRGLGAAGVAIDPAPPRGIAPSVTAAISALPILTAWLGWKRVLTMSFKSFSATFANTLPEQERRATYDQQIVPAPGRIYFQASLGVGNGVNFRNPERPPLLLVAAAEDKTVTPSMVKAMHRKQSRAPSRTDIMEFRDRSHWLIAEKGWEEVADAVLEWSVANAR